jgi:hypothetical protein
MHLTAQVETLLKTHDPRDDVATEPPNNASADSNNKHRSPNSSNIDLDSPSMTPSQAGMSKPEFTSRNDPVPLDDLLNGGESFTWEMIGLGVDEPLPVPEVVDEL